MRIKYKVESYRFSLYLIVIALAGIGVLLVGSAESSLQRRQLAGVIIGVVLMTVVSLINYSFILIFYRIMYLVNIALLLMVQFFGESSNNAQRWLKIGGIQFQPSELCKILLILFFAQYIMEHEEDLNKPKTIFKLLLLLAVPTLLVLQQPDLSTAIVIIFVFCILLFAAGLSYKIIIGVFAALIPMGCAAIFIAVKYGATFLKEYQYERIMAFIHPEDYLLTTMYQQYNSMIAIGSGQLLGKGLNNNEISSVNGNWISEVQTDFIFTVAGEELGFLGCFVIILLLMLIVVSCLLIARQAKDMSGKLICTGMAALIGIQSFINIAVATGLIPNTGLPLPFVSYGLTSLVTLFTGMGVVLNVGLQRKIR